MSEEYIMSCGVSSLDVEVCDGCHKNFMFDEVEKYYEELFCKECLKEIKEEDNGVSK